MRYPEVDRAVRSLVADAVDATLSFPAVADALRTHHVPESEMPRALGALIGAGIALPEALAALAAAPSRPSAAEMPLEPVQPLNGDETLDLSGISLADLA